MNRELARIAAPLGEIGGRLFFDDSMAEYGHLLGVRYKPMLLNLRVEKNSMKAGGFRGLEQVTKMLPVLKIFVPHPGRDAFSGEVVSAIAFHPHLMQIAIAVTLADQSVVRLYDVSSGREVALLSHGFMTDVRCMDWKPQSKSTLVVGCTGGVLVWNVEELRCIFYPCGKTTAATLAFVRGDARLIAVGSNDLEVFIHDLSLPPVDSLLHVKRCLDGGTAALRFSSDNSLLIHCCRQAPILTLWKLSEIQTFRFQTEKPVLQLCSVGEEALDVYAARQEQTEGVIVLRILQQQLVLLARISTSNGVLGGAVRLLAASSYRLVTVTDSGRASLYHLQIDESAVTARHVGSFFVDDNTVLAASSDCFPNGTIIAATDGVRLHFIPCYHLK